MFDTSLTGVLSQVEAKKIVLPAMQRPFVWDADRITKLVDSLLRGFPLGTALLWKTSSIQRYRYFEKDVASNAGITLDFDSGNSSERYLVLDGQQRLTSLLVATRGSLDGRRLYVDALSGERGDKDPGEAYWDCRFLTENEVKALNEWPIPDGLDSPRRLFVRFHEVTSLLPADAGVTATERAAELGLDTRQTHRLTMSYMQCATALASPRALQIHLIDEGANRRMPIEEILEVFVRVNSAGLVLQKSDLLMSLFDLKWNDIQPELFRAVRDVNAGRPFKITRDDILKSLLLLHGAETRFDRLVADRTRVEELATELPPLLPAAKNAWKLLTVLLMDECKITTERFFRGGHNSLLPFVVYLARNPTPSPTEKQRLVVGIYLALMSTVFAGAEARMGSFARNECNVVGPFPLQKLARLVAKQYGITSLEMLLSRHLDLTLNIAHGGITPDDNNPDNLQRDHIFPRSTLEQQGVPEERRNHYANFHFLRGADNLNKSNTPPHEWFRKPGDQPSYSDADLRTRYLTWELLQPGNFPRLLEERRSQIQKRALTLFGTDEQSFEQLFEEPSSN